MKEAKKWILVGILIFVALYGLGYFLIPRYQYMGDTMVLDTRTGDVWAMVTLGEGIPSSVRNIEYRKLLSGP